MPSKSHLISVARALALAYIIALVIAAFGQRWLIYPVWAAAAVSSDHVPIEGADHVSLFGARDAEAEARFRPR